LDICHAKSKTTQEKYRTYIDAKRRRSIKSIDDGGQPQVEGGE
jgi:hypothetical protein